ncbi:hypothetical protein OS493_013929 [Desmophyllum pertusum]|uniref:EF-hand domain-containing protein n=1 Tax=Desmophyllum pertusum TaxID=174260 RepID=A0A9W9ZQ59_9CNID|nr:hypothetical protein OS493_013929 [Desmophyllum pertusum]
MLSKGMLSIAQQINRMQQDIEEEGEKTKVLKQIELFVLDNSLRESTVGQLRGHTIENKWKIYNEIKKVGFKHIIVASFSHMTRLGDTFCRQLKERGEDFTNLFAFTEFLESIDKDGIPDAKTIPIGLLKMKEFGIKNVIIEMDLVYRGIDYKKFKVEAINDLLSERMAWIRKHLSQDSKVFVNLRDLPDAMIKRPKRIFKVISYLSSLPPNERPFGLVYEESGKYLPEQLGAWTAAIRREMDACGFKDGHLLVHVHEQWGMADSTQLQCLANGANGIWASLIIQGASMGHSCSTVTLMNLARLGNKKVLEQYNCTALREAAQEVCRITTGFEPNPLQVVYGERALDMVFGMPNFTPGKKEFNMAKFFGEKPVMRMTTLASPMMIVQRLNKLFGEDPQFTEERGQRMKEVMLEDLHKNIKEEYMSAVGIAMLFDRSGGHLTGQMSEVITQYKPKTAHAQELIAEIRVMWDEWDLREGEKGDQLEFDAFYNGFLAPYFGCYRCDETKQALKAIDMDEDGTVDWNEFALYLKWAIREYPQTKTAEDLLSVAFRKGLIPSMQDEVLKQS